MAQYLSDDEVFGGASAGAAAYLSDDEVFGAREEAPATDFGDAATGMMNPAKPAPAKAGPKPEGTWADTREGSWDDRGEGRKGIDSAVTGIKSMRPAFGIAGSSLVVQRVGERMENWDKIDRGESVPRAEGLAYQRADAAGRQKLREEQLSVASKQKDFIADSVKLVKQYQQEQQRNKGATSDFTDIESIKGFEEWLKFNGAAGAVYLAPVMISAAVGGPAGALATSYLLAAGEQNSDRVAAAIDMNRPSRFKNPDRQDAVDPTQGIAARVAETVPQTAAFAVPNALMDAVSGPVGNVLTKPLKGLTRREAAKAAPGMVGRDVVEEGITGTLQEGVNIAAERYAGEQQGDILTRENAKRLINAGTAEAAGGLVGGSAMAGVGVAAAPTVRTPEQSAASVMAAPTVDDAIAAATAETSAPIPAAPAARPPAANPTASAAVDRIAEILGQPQETTNVGDPVGTPGQSASSSGAGGNVGVGGVLDGGLQPAVGGRGSEPAGGTVGRGDAPVPAGSGAAAGADALAPAAVWFGRAGNGYATPEDAQAALPSRQRVQGDLDWKIEQTPEGRFRLAGYAQNGVDPTQSGVAPQPSPLRLIRRDEISVSQGGTGQYRKPQMVMNPQGTLTITGSARSIEDLLQANGVTKVLRGANGVIVGKSEATRAQQVVRNFFGDSALEPQVRDVTQRIQRLEQATNSVAAAPAQRENVADEAAPTPTPPQQAAPSAGVPPAVRSADGRADQRVDAPDGDGRNPDNRELPVRDLPVVEAVDKGQAAVPTGQRQDAAGSVPEPVTTPQFRATLNPSGIAEAVAPEPVISLGKSGPKLAGGRNARSDAYEKNPFKVFLAKHGIGLTYRKQFAPGLKEQRAAMVRGWGPIFKKSGLAPDLLAQRAVEEGFLRDEDFHAVTDLIHRALAGEKITPLHAEGVAENEMQARIDRQRQLEEDAARDVAALSDESLELLNAPPFRDVESNISTADAMRLLGFSEQEINDAVAAEQAGTPEAGQGGVESVEAASREAQAADRGREGQAQEGLTRPSEQDILAQQRRREEGERTESSRRTEEDNRARADAQRGEFALSGSDRAADANPAQRDLTDTNKPAVTPATAKQSTPSSETAAADQKSQRELVELRKRKSVLESLLTCLG
jgi:hypothetical protein